MSDLLAYIDGVAGPWVLGHLIVEMPDRQGDLRATE